MKSKSKENWKEYSSEDKVITAKETPNETASKGVKFLEKSTIKSINIFDEQLIRSPDCMGKDYSSFGNIVEINTTHGSVRFTFNIDDCPHDYQGSAMFIDIDKTGI